MEDKYYMERALALAEQGAGFVNPNPMVGAVIVKDSQIIGEGYHEKYGGLHAERNALKDCKEKGNNPKGATMYVTLEPCCHYGKTPPCTEAIIESGIERVVIGTLDVNPVVAGKGAQILRDNGIRVEVGMLENECKKLNRVFNKYMSTKLPYVVMKYAMTADGKIATASGESKWITGDAARENVHRLRKNLSGIMVGVSTVIIDNPSLDCRLDEPSNNPVRIICDSYLRTPINSKIVETASEIKTIIATSSENESRIAEYEKAGCTVLKLPRTENGIDLNSLMVELGNMGIDSILLEGGGTINFSALESKIVDEIHIHMAPKIFGGNSKSPVEGLGISDINDAIKLNPINTTWAGDDLIIENEVIY
ncbi:bifunctional diaminohydroxyphosphoribosylaminopyrimidine deaminase/5-amino-6-(5-phosphoribosylamino)uracil reductase RibD [Pseudobutyrivibrio xylanivorans]|uniref:Riboflavin biosynthesis protein RibD n=1 Tax=Pseudobutyrivibrio xylanivorans TaxID=185007 RepID=A0A5P6VNY5_PSEXY|nr:bifunctional diaminohydroxyphosphoribosylaminopyrimidine deaminase/5-amino-6-(5-phosphoribosylamino)uracil reductase RibD [Pseudobutyrivibrio xylanivorans]QFJ54386.1 bifunctional diaminohydroxyphosphoribosylaminopyrimidine deaminase/5-amino-6-(5-phosphoribosylamino)uracil reductase RibD [Pseudobutyrivibrio xylanivorans]